MGNFLVFWQVLHLSVREVALEVRGEAAMMIPEMRINFEILLAYSLKGQSEISRW